MPKQTHDDQASRRDGSALELAVRPDPERAAFEAWLQEPVAAGEDPAPWLDGLAPEAAWQAWKHRGAEIARLRAELAALNTHVAYWRRIGIDDQALARASAALTA